jgi:hypothetical protein
MSAGVTVALIGLMVAVGALVFCQYLTERRLSALRVLQDRNDRWLDIHEDHIRKLEYDLVRLRTEPPYPNLAWVSKK